LPACPGEAVTTGVTPSGEAATGRTVKVSAPPSKAAVASIALFCPSCTNPPRDLTGPENVVIAIVFLHTKLSLSVVYASAGAVMISWMFPDN
jgi:hypothetical protein